MATNPAIVQGNELSAIAVFIEEQNGDLVDIEFYCRDCAIGRDDCDGAERWPAYEFSPDYNTHCAECSAMIHQSQPITMDSFDRIGVLEVLSLLAHDYGLYGVVARLNDLQFRMAPGISGVEDLAEEWQKDLYKRLEARAFETDSYSARTLARI